MEPPGGGRQDDSAMAVHDRLGQAGGAAGIKDPQRVIEGQPFGLERRDRSVIARDSHREVDGAGHPFPAAAGDKEQRLDGGQLPADFSDRAAPVHRLAGII